jgi:hypothetical protein
MAYTVTYKRRTQTGKMTTVKRRVAGNRPSPSSPSPGTTVPSRAKKPAARKGQITSAKRPSASKQFKTPASQKKSPTMSRSNALRIVGTATGIEMKRQAASVKKEIGRATKRVAGAVTRNKGSMNLAFGKASILMDVEREIRRAEIGKTPTPMEIAGRSALTLGNRRFSNMEQAVVVSAALSLDAKSFRVLLNKDIARKMKRGQKSDPFNMALLKG